MNKLRMSIRNHLVTYAMLSLFLQLWGFPALAQSASVSSQQLDTNTDIQQVIHDYILTHPDVLIQSLQMAKAKQQERFAAVVKSKIASFRKDLVEDPDAPILGNPKGDITLVEFFDYRCPFCRQVEPSLQTLIKDDPGVRIVQKEFPILGRMSVYAAHVALAAQKQGKHTQFHDALMAESRMAENGNIDETAILQIAASVGLDVDRIKVDMNSPEVNSEIERSAQIAKALGLTGTPAFILGTELVPGATDLATLKAMVDDARHGVN
jgi:protein-disulfide isomerase